MKPADRPYLFLSRKELLGRREGEQQTSNIPESAQGGQKSFELGVQGVKGDQVETIPHLPHLPPQAMKGSPGRRVREKRLWQVHGWMVEGLLPPKQDRLGATNMTVRIWQAPRVAWLGPSMVWLNAESRLALTAPFSHTDAQPLAGASVIPNTSVVHRQLCHTAVLHCHGYCLGLL